MDLQHRFTVPTTVDETWAHFQDIAAVAECFPGATVTSVDPDSFSGSVKVKLGPISLLYNGSGTFLEKDEAAHRFVVEAKGKDKRGNGTAGATVTLSMSDAAGAATDVEVLTDLSITGKPAQFGRGVMQDVSDKLLGQFVACLETRLSGPPAEVGAGAEAGDQDAEPASMPTGAAASSSPTGDEDAGPASVPGPTTGVVTGASDAAASAASPSAPTSASSGASTGAARPAPTAAAGPRHAAPAPDDALDLGATVLPVLAKAYWKQGAVLLALVALIWWVVSRRD